jgi:hypothetical protein
MVEVVQFQNRDCWRTWFFEECEANGLFGINEIHIKIITNSISPYLVGTELYLEDAPVLRGSLGRFHRICGPYEVISATPVPTGAMIVYTESGKPILYREAHPELGPWGNGTKQRPNICGINLTYRQMARNFNYYPYRFRIKRSRRWEELLILHSSSCELND